MSIPDVPAPTARERLTAATRILPDLVRLGYRLVKDSRVPIRRRAFAVAALGYVALPVDLVPDVIPGLGQVDDVLMVALAVRMLIDAAGDEIVAEHWDGSEEVLDVVDGLIDLVAGLVPKRVRWALQRVIR